MKRLLFLLFVLPLMGFTLIDFSLTPATPLVWFEARGPGTGTFAHLAGYNAIDTAATQVVVESRIYQRVKPVRLTINITTAGVGAGNFTFDAFDATAAGIMCTSAAISCTATGVQSVDCLATGTATAVAQSDVRLRILGGTCTNSPLGSMALEYTEALADEGVDFIPRFLPKGLFGLDGGGTSFGTDSYQFNTITCEWESAGVVSGGTDVMRMQLIQKSDAGVVCTCDLPGTCADAQHTEHTCTCNGGIKYLGTQVEDGRAIDQGYAIQLGSSTNCALNPRGFVCAIPFRK